MELVRKLPRFTPLCLPSSRFSWRRCGRVRGGGGQRRGGGVGGVEWCAVTRLRRDFEQTPQHPNISPHISHARVQRSMLLLAAPPTGSEMKTFMTQLEGILSKEPK